MTIWWLGNLVLVAVVVPAVVHLLRGVLTAALTVRAVIDDLAVVGTAILVDLEPVPELVTTQQHVTQTAAGLASYGSALEEVL